METGRVREMILKHWNGMQNGGMAAKGDLAAAGERRNTQAETQENGWDTGKIKERKGWRGEISNNTGES